MVAVFSGLAIQTIKKMRRDARVAYQQHHKTMSMKYDHEWLKARTVHIKGIPALDRNG
jgi:hypothetical protein